MSLKTKTYLSAGLVIGIIYVAIFFQYWFHVFPKKVNSRAYANFSVASVLNETGQFGQFDSDLYGRVEHQIGFFNPPPDVTPDSQRAMYHTDLRGGKANAWPEDNENLIAFMFLGIWKVTGSYTVFPILIFFFLMQALSAFLYFVIAYRISGLLTASITALLYIAYIPMLVSATQMQNHWIAGVAPVLLCFFWSQPFEKFWKNQLFWIFGSLLLGAIILLRNAALPVLGVWGLFILWKFWREGYLRVVQRFAAAILPAFLLINGVNFALKTTGSKPQAHTVWAQVFIGLADMPKDPTFNNPVFAPEDGLVVDYEKKIDPTAIPMTEKWEGILKSEVFRMFRERPDLFLGAWWNRFLRVILSMEEEFTWSVYHWPLKFTLRYCLWFFGLLGLVVCAIQRNGRAGEVFAILFAAGSTFLFECTFILAKVPRYYVGWSICYLLPMGWLVAKVFQLGFDRIKLYLNSRV